MTALSNTLDTMVQIEKEDLRVAVLLVHPEDLRVLSEHQDYVPLDVPQPRLEWEGQHVGTIWSAALITTDRVLPGEPDAIPMALGVRGLVASLKDAREHWFNQDPPPPKLEGRLQKVIFKTRCRLIKILGGEPPFDPFTRVTRRRSQRQTRPQG